MPGMTNEGFLSLVRCRALAILMRRAGITEATFTAEDLRTIDGELLESWDPTRTGQNYRVKLEGGTLPGQRSQGLVRSEPDWVFWRRMITTLMQQHGIREIPIPEQDRMAAPMVQFEHVHGPDERGGYWRLRLRDPSVPSVPSEMTTHGAPPETNAAAMQDALLAAGLPPELRCGSDYCFWCSHYQVTLSQEYECDMDGCRRAPPLGARWCRYHLCLAHRRSRCCAVRRCDGIWTDLLCTAHNTQWEASTNASLPQWLSQFEHPPTRNASPLGVALDFARAGQSVALAMGGAMGQAVSQFVGAARREVRPGDLVTADMLAPIPRPPRTIPPPVIIHFTGPILGPLPDNEELRRIICRATGAPARCCRGGCTEPRETGHAFCKEHRL